MKKWLVSSALLIAAVQIPAMAQMVQPTRFGLLEANDQNILQFEGKPFEQAVYLERPDYTMVRFQQDEADVIFLRQNKGDNCPQKFAIVRVTRDGATGMTELGTCSSTVIRPAIHDQIIRFSQPEPDGKSVVRYEYDGNGVLTEARDSSLAGE